MQEGNMKYLNTLALEPLRTVIVISSIDAVR